MLKKDPSYDPAKMSHSEYTQLFQQSMREWDGLFNSNNPDLRQFRLLGKKMISWHSVNDEAVSVNAMRQYYEKVLVLDKGSNVTTQDYHRYFEAAGAMHCSAPPGIPYPLNALKTLQSWVEEGVSPEELPAVPLGDMKSNKQIRSICVYPKRAVLKESGFICEQPIEKAQDIEGYFKDEL
jgi:hypothetical protein